jgi:hypothetical protein
MGRSPSIEIDMPHTLSTLQLIPRAGAPPLLSQARKTRTLGCMGLADLIRSATSMWAHEGWQGVKLASLTRISLEWVNT